MVDVICGNCAKWLSRDALRERGIEKPVDLTFLDPPFNQGKAYAAHDDSLPEDEYWAWMTDVAARALGVSPDGAAIYFMQREKNTEQVLRCLRESGWTFQNLIIWKKQTSAVPGRYRFGKQFQVIVFATKGNRPRVFHRLRIDPPLPSNYKYERKNGLYVTDVWDDIRELTSGYFAGDEAIRDENDQRAHEQQSPLALLLRIVLSSTNPGDVVLDPFAGSGTTLAVADQLNRNGIGIEIDERNVALIEQRLKARRSADDVMRFAEDYVHTEGLDAIWGAPLRNLQERLDFGSDART
ncbi:MAG: site-specific DNA-methyltransferase [Candidatus Poribacteria bacterium]|nr:site-specific DNA-methyltransferase [Candidatus Poribacteria bacterium]